MSKITNNIYIGNAYEARDWKWLKSNGITHIINAALELKNSFPGKFKYLRLDLMDIPTQGISSALDKSFKFIEDAVKSGGKVFVHCQAGVSRSSSVIINYLMLKNGWSYEQALQYMREKHPPTNPNYGFSEQLRRKDHFVPMDFTPLVPMFPPITSRTRNYGPALTYGCPFY